MSMSYSKGKGQGKSVSVPNNYSADHVIDLSLLTNDRLANYAPGVKAKGKGPNNSNANV